MNDALPPVLTWRYERIDTASVEPLASGREIRDATTLDVHEIEVERDEARQILQDIHDTIDERSKYYLIEEVVLGDEIYVKADIYCRCAYEASLENTLGIDVTVVPGDMIEPVVPTKKRIEEYLEERGRDD
ncbi:hypothetical protein [Natrinema sp. DC36]|uniref:hypothetical protein n=1 Tax=Natrinema sp. DC36 TaxID=2878680 RepID=UPI001CF053AC|nr:hypothetical protein [Natrinema sp. DC36]